MKAKTFNPMDVNTWKVEGTSSRWKSKYKIEGYDGLVVLGAVSRGMIKEECNKHVWNQQLYILALENALREHPSENHAVLKHGSTSTLSDFVQILCRVTL